jgi:hypothetical protein
MNSNIYLKLYINKGDFMKELIDNVPVEINGFKTDAVIGDRKAYSTPCLHVYGAVELVTQGSKSALWWDGSAVKRTGSDRSLKEKILHIGTHPIGVGLYLFDYKLEFHALTGSGRRVGVMADEVEAVLPQAVSVHPQGHKMVDYAMLGIRSPSECVN